MILSSVLMLRVLISVSPSMNASGLQFFLVNFPIGSSVPSGEASMSGNPFFLNVKKVSVFSIFSNSASSSALQNFFQFFFSTNRSMSSCSRQNLPMANAEASPPRIQKSISPRISFSSSSEASSGLFFSKYSAELSSLCTVLFNPLIRRSRTSRSDLKSSISPGLRVFILNLRYSFLYGLPSMNTTWLATVAVPPKCEMS